MRVNRLLVLVCLLLSLLGSTARPWLPWWTDRPIDPMATGWCSASTPDHPSPGDNTQPSGLCLWCAASAWALAQPPTPWALRLDLAQHLQATTAERGHHPPVLAAFRARAPPQAALV